MQQVAPIATVVGKIATVAGNDGANDTHAAEAPGTADHETFYSNVHGLDSYPSERVAQTQTPGIRVVTYVPIECHTSNGAT